MEEHNKVWNSTKISSLYYWRALKSNKSSPNIFHELERVFDTYFLDRLSYSTG